MHIRDDTRICTQNDDTVQGLLDRIMARNVTSYDVMPGFYTLFSVYVSVDVYQQIII